MKELKIKKTEIEKQKSFIAKLRANGYLVFKLNDSYIAGLPDIMAIKDGVVRFIELKNKDRSGAKLSLEQVHLHSKMLEHGVEVEVIYL